MTLSKSAGRLRALQWLCRVRQQWPGPDLVSNLCHWVHRRSVSRPWIERLMGKRPLQRQFDAAICWEGWRIACLVRLSPAMPFAAKNHMPGLSSISFRDDCIGTFGSMPALFGYVTIGALAGAGVHAWSSGVGWFRASLLAAGMVATGLAAWRITQSFSGMVGDPLQHLENDGTHDPVAIQC